jgi:hypothetical protein
MKNLKLINCLKQFNSEIDFLILKENELSSVRGGNCPKLLTCGDYSLKSKKENPNPLLKSCSNYTLNGKKIKI